MTFPFHPTELTAQIETPFHDHRYAVPWLSIRRFVEVRLPPCFSAYTMEILSVALGKSVRSLWRKTQSRQSTKSVRVDMEIERLLHSYLITGITSRATTPYYNVSSTKIFIK